MIQYQYHKVFLPSTTVEDNAKWPFDTRKDKSIFLSYI